MCPGAVIASRTRWRVLVGTATVLPAVAVLALLAYGFTREGRYIETPLLGRVAPGFTLPLLDGGSVRLEDLRGRVVFVNFWASWCPPCRVEAPALEALWKATSRSDAVFLGVNTQDDDARARAFVSEFGLTYPIARDRGGRVAIDYGVWGLPEAYVIDRDGRITYKHVGAIGSALLAAKLDEARRGIVSAAQGRGDYQGVR